MIPEYKLYHGAVLSELIDVAPFDVVIGELREEGRLSSYILDQCIGLHVKHATARLPPWQFTITKSNLAELFDLAKTYRHVFVVLVCRTDGIVALSIGEVADIIDTAGSDQAWIRVERSRGEKYSINGNGTALKGKKAKGLSAILDLLRDRQTTDP